MTGSRAVTRPRAGRIQAGPLADRGPPNHDSSPRRVFVILRLRWMYGSRFATTMSFVLLRRGPSVAISSADVMPLPAPGLFARGEPPQKGIDIRNAVKLMRGGGWPAPHEDGRSVGYGPERVFVGHIVAQKDNGWAA